MPGSGVRVPHNPLMVHKSLEFNLNELYFQELA